MKIIKVKNCRDCPYKEFDYPSVSKFSVTVSCSKAEAEFAIPFISRDLIEITLDKLFKYCPLEDDKEAPNKETRQALNETNLELYENVDEIFKELEE